MAGIVLVYVKSTPLFHVYTPEASGNEAMAAEGFGSLYIAKSVMEIAEPRIWTTWPHPPESGR